MGISGISLESASQTWFPVYRLESASQTWSADGPGGLSYGTKCVFGADLRFKANELERISERTRAEVEISLSGAGKKMTDTDVYGVEMVKMSSFSVRDGSGGTGYETKALERDLGVTGQAKTGNRRVVFVANE